VWVVGEAPGADEDQAGIPFVGRSGQELDRMLLEAGFTSGDCCFTNPFKVRPPNNDLERLNEYGIPNEVYLNQFWEELETWKPPIVIACGATPLSILCPHTRSKRDGTSKITQWRGSLLLSKRLPTSYVVPVLHPAAVLRTWSERQIAILCLGRAREERDYVLSHNGKLQPLPERELITEPAPQVVLEFLHEATNQREAVSNDMETIGGKYPYTFSVAVSPKRAISFNFWLYDDDWCVRIWRSLDLLLRTHRTIGQNYIGFDCHELDTLGFNPTVGNVSDTMVRHHTLWPEFEQKLQFQTFQYTREPYYKDEGKLWSPAEGQHQLQLYNCKDTVVTYEVHNRQEEEFDDRPHLRDFYNNVAIKRARAFYRMDNRGLLVNTDKLLKLRNHIVAEIDKNCIEAESLTGRHVASASCLFQDHKQQCKCNLKAIAAMHGCKQKDVLNLGSPKQLIDQFKTMGIKLPLKRAAKGKPSRESVDEITLRKIVLNNNTIRLPFTIMNLRELGKIKGTYVDAKLLDSVLYTSYSPTGTITFRSSARGNIFGYGTNLSNLPKHSELGMMYRECLEARPGKILLVADQKGAEDWIVQGIIVDNGGSSMGLDELVQGINRHRKLASFLFGKPTTDISKESLEYHLGKRTRHAGNYDMRENTMADNILKDLPPGTNPIPPVFCKWLLEKFHEAEPDIRGVFHEWVKETLKRTRVLRNPLGFERIFFGLRPYDNNEDVFREGYAQVPQSTVACNNGMAIVYLDERNAPILKDDHDAVTLEIDDNINEVVTYVKMVQSAYDRVIKFPNGLEVRIPAEFELGYNLKAMETLKDETLDNINEALKKVRACREHSVAVG